MVGDVFIYSFRHEISEIPRPIAVKLRVIAMCMVALYNPLLSPTTMRQNNVKQSSCCQLFFDTTDVKQSNYSYGSLTQASK